ncbi:hypothetical protein BPTFM16_00955 [Altererythrobacter insulae]|nr:hypothetical protein BPTFM16_00955 [Altererythrobacter insulae]
MILRAFAAAFALSLAAPSWAGEGPNWRNVDETTGQIRDVDGLEQLARDFPDSGTVRLRMLQPLLAAGKVEKVMETFEWLYDRGYVFSDVAQEQIPKLLEGVDPGRIAERLRAEAEVIEASEVVATVPAEHQLVEGAGRTATGSIVAGSILASTIAVSDREGNWISIEGLSGDAYGPMVRKGETSFWMSSGAPDMITYKKNAFHGVFLLNAETGDISRSIKAPDEGFPSDIAVGSNGCVFASDPFEGKVYSACKGDVELHTLIAPGTFRSPQGLATSADNTKLYVSDYRYGIAVIDLETRDVSRLASDIPVILDGVDGLWRYGNELIAVQNGTSPMRISAFELSENGMRVIGHRVLEQAHGEWTEPLSGSIDGDALIYVGNGQWDRYFEGELKEGMEALPTQIRRLPLLPAGE